ncbi:MAG TPA: DMT family transporter [Vicinamibacteria bacterium]|nr:DMT family transporter [Vicinamibacteria bacterium]
MDRTAPGEARGLALIVVSTLAYGVLPILGKIAYADGVAPLPLLAWRYLIAALLIALLLRGPQTPLRDRLRLWGIGSVFVLNSIAYFRALQAVPASVVALLLYSYPVMVTLLAALAGLERLTARSLLAAAAAFGGCALTAVGARPGAPVSTSGIAWALTAAFVYASYIVLSGRFGTGVPARVLALHLAQASAVVCTGLALAGPGMALPPSPRAWLTVAAIGVVPTVVASITFLAGMTLVGPTRASVLASLEVIVTLGLAFVLLGERLSAWQWAGALLILGAVAWQNLGTLRALAARRRAPAPPGRRVRDRTSLGAR